MKLLDVRLASFLPEAGCAAAVVLGIAAHDPSAKETDVWINLEGNISSDRAWSPVPSGP